AALRAVTYYNTSDAPSVDARTISFVVSDGPSNSAAATTMVTLTAVNDAPTVGTAANLIATEDSSFSYSIPADLFQDPDGDSLTLTATLADGTDLPNWLSFDAATGTFSGTPGNDEVGRMRIRVTATDRAGESVSTDFDLDVLNTNDAPTRAGGRRVGMVDEDSASSYRIPANTFADVDAGDTLTLTATLADGSALPTWLTFDAGSGTFSGTPANGDVGTLSIRVTATDQANASVSTDFSLEVININDAPTAGTIANQAATEDAPFSFSIPANTFVDVDAGDSLTLTATLGDGSALPEWLSFDAA